MLKESLKCCSPGSLPIIVLRRIPFYVQGLPVTLYVGFILPVAYFYPSFRPMMQIRQTLLAAFLFFSLTTTAQKKDPVLLLKAGRVKTDQNITEATVDHFNRNAPRHRDKAFAVLQFESLPTAETRRLLDGAGIELLEYIPENAYTVSITGRMNASLLKRAGARALLQPTSRQKMHAALATGNIPAWAKKAKGMVDVWVSFPKVFTVAEVAQYLEEQKMEVRSTQHSSYRIVEVRLPLNRLEALVSLPYIEYVEPIPREPQPLNANSRTGARANVLNAAVGAGGRGLAGEGVAIGIGDNGNIQSHADLSGSRLVNKVWEYSGAGSHAIHVSATAAGAGVVNELYQGYAPKATIISSLYSGIISYPDPYVQDYGMVLTSNSYITGDAWCGTYGNYSFYSRMMDQQAFDFPHLQHVFAAGNDGRVLCNGYPAGFHTVYGSVQAAKNVITVGATEWNGVLWDGSSKGPVADGRLKPEITAQGAAVYSGTLNNGYTYAWGTSMASPAVAGGLALLYQRYRQLHGGSDPKNALVKALLCNGGADLGNKGPDHSYGFGWMHLGRSVELLEKEHYKEGSLTNGGQQTYTISVSPGTAQLKVMLYWNDPPAAAMSSRALVNDLDLAVSDPASTLNLPRVLDPSATGVQNTALTGADHINNIEQVVIDNPTPGTYTINITGAVAQNPAQDYVVVYDIIPASVTLTSPAGGQGVAPGERIQVNWDAYGAAAAPFTLQYSTDNGTTWTNIATGIDAGSRRYEWAVPDVPTNRALVRIEQEGTGLTSTTPPFTIIGVPALFLSEVQCEGYIALTWTPVPGATDYEVLMKRDNEMVPVSTTASTTYTLSGLSPDSLYWVSVRARVEGSAGRRATALSRQPLSGTCAGTISDNDLKLDTILSRAVGRKYTATELTATYHVTIRVKNLDDAPASGFTARYKLNNKDWVSESVNVSIPAGTFYDYTFTTNEDLSAVGSYTLVTVVKNNTPDAVSFNDTLGIIIRQLDNRPIDLTEPFLDDLESATTAVYTKDTMGLAGIDRYDFMDNSTNGRLSTVSTSGAVWDSKGLVLSANRYNSAAIGAEAVTGTYNLERYHASIQDIRLIFDYTLSYGSSTENKLMVRGSDDQDWIELWDFQAVRDLNPNNMDFELSDSLLRHGQEFSSSFQLKWSNALGNSSTLGVDNIKIYEATDDVQLISIDPTFVLGCGEAPLQLVLRNSSNRPLTNVPVHFNIDEGTWVSETIPFIAANSTLNYTFSTPPHFSAPGLYSVKAWVNFPTDNIRLNDTMYSSVNYSSLVRSFPYLENFEAGKGGWYTVGANSIWQHGTPASAKLSRAASGTKAWKTGILRDANDYESLILYSPCFDISGLTHPMLSFSIATDLKGCSNNCDIAWVEYSTDNQTWEYLTDDVSAGTNWFQANGWEEQKLYWHVATISLPKNKSTIRFRFIKYTNYRPNTEGIAIDDIHIYDSTQAIYDGVSPSITATQPVSGSGWVHFEREGKLIASILPNGQDLGNTDVQAYIHSGAVRFNSQQYYHDRNITIKPQVATLIDSVTVRMYFLDSETEALVHATGCSGCTKPGSAYELGISKYSDPSDAKENGTLADNDSPGWSFIPSTNVTIVPFQKGYYAEFKVKDFSEFWLNNGGLDGLTSLPVELVSFTAQKGSGEEVLLKWSTAGETNASHYEVEVAKGEADLQAGRFTRIGQVQAAGNTTALTHYSYTDEEPGKTATRFYRLKIVDSDGSFAYSPVRSVVFNSTTRLQVYPNPSTGVFNLAYQLNTHERLDAVLYDVKGRVIKTYSQPGSAHLLTIDLSPSTFAPGVYLLQTEVNGKREFFKLHKL